MATEAELDTLRVAWERAMRRRKDAWIVYITSPLGDVVNSLLLQAYEAERREEVRLHGKWMAALYDGGPVR